MPKVAVTARVKAKAGMAQALIAAFGALLEQVESEPGTLLYAVNRSTDDPHLFWVYELYTDGDAFAAHSGSDAMAAAGMPDGTYQLGPIQVEVKDGKCTSNGSLAGSVLTMDRAVRNIKRFSHWTLREAVRAATLNATRAVGLAQHGELAPGAEANIIVLSADGEVRRTIVRGHC